MMTLKLCVVAFTIINLSNAFIVSDLTDLIFGGNDKNSKPQLALIDADFCADDMIGTMVLAMRKDLQIKVITVTYGNVGLDITGPNALRLANFLDLKDTQIYLGAEKPMVPAYTKIPGFEAFGADGIGGASAQYQSGNRDFNQSLKAHEAMIQFVNQHPGEVNIYAFGPLTNLAQAQQKDPTFLSKTKRVYIMGGNIYGRGNAFHDRPSAGEFNFAMDPLAAKIVLTENDKLTEVYPWETCQDYAIPWKTYDRAVRSTHTRYGKMFKALTTESANTFRQWDNKGYEICDLLAAFVFLDPKIIDKSVLFNATVETEGIYTNGMMVVQKVRDQSASNVVAIQAVDLDLQERWLMKFVSQK